MTEPGPERPPEAGGDWERLDPRMLLIGPVKIARQAALPGLVAVIGVGTQRPVWTLVALPFVLLGLVLLGLVPWFTTYYRVTDTQLQVRRGLLNRRLLTAPLDRVRSVDLEASVLHRLLSLTKVEVGTGVDDSRIELDALSVAAAQRLQHFLLERSLLERSLLEGEASTGAQDPEGAAAPASVDAATTLAELDWAWLRFAPLNLATLVVVAGALGVLSQFADDLPIFDSDRIEGAWQWILTHSVPLLVVLLVLGALLAWLLVSTIEYAVRWYGLRLFRERGNLRLTAGLLTTRSTSVEEARIRGVEVTEPLLMRAAGGARLATLATGVEDGVVPVLPPAPVAVTRRVATDVLGDADPLEVPLVPHGAAARRRCHVRNQWVTLLGVVATVVPVVALGWPAWLPVLVGLLLAGVGVGVAELEYRNLGHALTGSHLVAGSGALSRRRTVLERDGIIGWVLTQNPFQRRAGLATLVATTAAGAERVVVRDLAHPVGVALADRATPGMLTTSAEGGTG